MGHIEVVEDILVGSILGVVPVFPEFAKACGDVSQEVVKIGEAFDAHLRATQRAARISRSGIRKR